MNTGKKIRNTQTHTKGTDISRINNFVIRYDLFYCIYLDVFGLYACRSVGKSQWRTTKIENKICRDWNGWFNWVDICRFAHTHTHTYTSFAPKKMHAQKEMKAIISRYDEMSSLYIGSCVWWRWIDVKNNRLLFRTYQWNEKKKMEITEEKSAFDTLQP